MNDNNMSACTSLGIKNVLSHWQAKRIKIRVAINKLLLPPPLVIQVIFAALVYERSVHLYRSKLKRNEILIRPKYAILFKSTKCASWQFLNKIMGKWTFWLHLNRVWSWFIENKEFKFNINIMLLFRKIRMSAFFF
jgi:hypothetical protein